LSQQSQLGTRALTEHYLSGSAHAFLTDYLQTPRPDIYNLACVMGVNCTTNKPAHRHA